jgi:hypothetical protein
MTQVWREELCEEDGSPTHMYARLFSLTLVQAHEEPKSDQVIHYPQGQPSLSNLGHGSTTDPESISG